MRARAADGFECVSTTSTLSSNKIIAALQFTLYAGFEIAAHTPSAIGWMSNRSSAALVEMAVTTESSARQSMRFIAAPGCNVRLECARRIVQLLRAVKCGTAVSI